jgi:hypothetical protein
VQTFLPYPDFQRTAATLDYKRLGKQRVEARQILKTIREPGQKAWQNHPAVNMWRGCQGALIAYGNAMIEEWIRRGYNNSMPIMKEAEVFPAWLGDDRFHSSHRAALLYKDYDYYSCFGWSETPCLNYYWPNGR